MADLSISPNQTQDAPPLIAEVDHKIALMMLKQAVAASPELGDEILGLIGEEYTASKASILFHYLFIAADSETGGAKHPVIGFRLRNSDERLLARSASDLKE